MICEVDLDSLQSISIHNRCKQLDLYLKSSTRDWFQIDLPQLTEFYYLAKYLDIKSLIATSCL